MLNGASFFMTVKKGKVTVFKASLYDINKAMEAKDLNERPLEELVLKQYHEFLPLYNKVFADRLPPHQPGIHHCNGSHDWVLANGMRRVQGQVTANLI